MLDYRVVAGIICQACEGLHSAHEARDGNGALLGVVHRDVSPPNIMVTADGTVKLLDFGIAKARGANSRTRTGTVKGKNAYMSPEQILGKPLDRRSDIFALGVVMYEMLAIKRLFHRDSDFLTFKAITEEPIPDIRDRRPDLPPGHARRARPGDGARSGRPVRHRAGVRQRDQELGRDARRSGVAGRSRAPAVHRLRRRDGLARRDPQGRRRSERGADLDRPDEAGDAAADPAAPAPQVGDERRDAALDAVARARSPTGHRDRRAVDDRAAAPTGEGRSCPISTNVLDLSADVGADSWMAEGGTDLLSSHRWKSLRNVAHRARRARGASASASSCSCR